MAAFFTLETNKHKNIAFAWWWSYLKNIRAFQRYAIDL
jgi:hypothetical protein